MKIFSAQQIKACDAYTIKASRISSVELMERAATRCANWIKDNYPRDSLFVVLCGNGNNGGDGLALTRILHQRGYAVKAFVLKLSDELSPDCNANLERLQQINDSLVSVVNPDTYITDLPGHIILIDAILGTGLSRPVTGWLASFIDSVNRLPNFRIAIDIPSGLPADLLPDEQSSLMQVHTTLSFQFYKRSFLHPESSRYTGNVHILDIGLDRTFINATHTQFQTIEDADIRAFYKPRNPNAHKGDHGHCHIIAGSYGKMGAAVLASRAALRAGAGLVTTHLPESGYVVLQTAVPEAMCTTNGAFCLERIEGWQKASSIAIGPGIGMNQQTIEAVSGFLDTCKAPVVADADALNIIAGNQDLLGRLPKNSILTPHPKEFARLFGENTNTMIQVDHARIQAMRYGINIVLKNHYTTVISSEGECWYNLTGNPGMATAGSGDVLTGIIAGLMAQGYEPIQAALMGVYIHGRAGDLAAAVHSMESMVAGDIVDQLGKVFLNFQVK